MTLMKQILRIFPRKRIDIEQLEYKPIAKGIQPNQTIRRNMTMTGTNGKAIPEEETDGMINGEYPILEREIMPEKIICPDCGGITLEGLEFCDKCGGDLTNY